MSTTNELLLKFIRSIACIQLCCWWFRRATHVLPWRLPCETAKTTPGKTNEIFERFDACCECRNYRHRGRTTTNIRPLASDGSTGEANSLTLFEKLEMSKIYAFRKYIASISHDGKCITHLPVPIQTNNRPIPCAKTQTPTCEDKPQ